MNLRTYFEETNSTQAALAQRLRVTQSLVAQWARGAAEPPPMRCVQIEVVTEGRVTRRDLRPDDWHLIWPELAWMLAWSEWVRARRNRRAAWRQFLRYGVGWLAALAR